MKYLMKQKTDNPRNIINKFRIRPGIFIVLSMQNIILSGEKCVDSSGNSTGPKTPSEAFFASDEAEAVPAESVVFSVAIS